MHALCRYVYEKLTALTHWVFNLEGAETFVWREWIWMKAVQYIYRLSANKEIVTTYHATPHSIGYVTHDKFIYSPNASLNPGV